ncbi:MAG: LVIVD repeat-containing protein [Gemmatimonas sp.]
MNPLFASERPRAAVFAASVAVAVAFAATPALAQPQDAKTVATKAGAYKPEQAEARNMREVGYDDLQARTAYQPTPKKQGDRWILYVGHHGGRQVNPLTGQEEENGTSILDVTDPKNPKYLFHIPGEKGKVVPGRETGGSQMTRVCNGEELPKGEKGHTYLLRTWGDSGHEVYDVTAPEKPVKIASIDGFTSTHKNDWECSTGIALIVGSGTKEKWRATRVTTFYDLSDPKNPKKIREYALPEQLSSAKGYNPGQIHGPISRPDLNRVFFGYGTNRRGVAQIVDREKLLKGDAEPTPESLKEAEIGRLNLPEFMGAHTTFPLYGMPVPNFAHDKEGKVRNFLVIVNEESVTVCGEPRQMVEFVDVTDEKRPMGVATFDVNERSGRFCDRGGRFGAHATNEHVTPIYDKRVLFVSYFNAGVRAIDVRDPYHPREAGYFIPAINKNTDPRCADEVNNTNCTKVIQINNMEVDDRGYIYAVDRANAGLFILEPTGDLRRIANFPRNQSVNR